MAKAAPKKEKEAIEEDAEDVITPPADPSPTITHLRNNSRQFISIFGHQRRIELPGLAVVPVDSIPDDVIQRLIDENPAIEVIVK